MTRTDEEFAIEFGEYMAKAAQRYMRISAEPYRDPEQFRESFNALGSAIYEFRKRAEKTSAWLGQPKTHEAAT